MIEDLVQEVFKLTDEQLDVHMEEGTLDDLLMERYGVDITGYQDIVDDIMPFTRTAQTAITGREHHVLMKNDGHGFSLYRQEVKQ